MLPGPVDLSAPAVVAHELADLRQKLRRKYRHVDEHLLDESIEDALLHYLRCPECFDSSRGVPLSSYVALSPRSYLYRKLRKEKRRRQHEKTYGVAGEIFEKIVSEMRAELRIYFQRDSEKRNRSQAGVAPNCDLGYTLGRHGCTTCRIS